LDPTSSGLVAAALAIAVIVLVVVVVVLWRRLSALERRLAGLTSAGDGRSLESTLHATLDRVGALATGVDQLTSRAAMLETVQRKAVQKTGLVRYNPFEDTGGNQSFAVALLDANGDGVVVSSLHARQNTRVYAKAVTGGRAEAALSDEEGEALRKAMAQGTPGAKPS
jgi:hypothetical protein